MPSGFNELRRDGRQRITAAAAPNTDPTPSATTSRQSEFLPGTKAWWTSSLTP
jgi:hypothetical protein